MKLYKIPDEYYFRLHHIRPRFKNDVENVLIYMAEELSRIDNAPKINAIFLYPGNAHKKLKTINNWRTEISALFGFVQYTNSDIYKASLRAKELATKQDLIEFFKTFLFCFQYPGAHIKPNAVLEQITKGIKFKPAQYILKMLKYACKKENLNVGITKAEFCHCVFNDLRVTRDNEGVERTWDRIVENRINCTSYDQTGDVIRYAGDIIDYLEIANLLKTYDSRTYYLNNLEEESIIKFCESTEWFSNYDEYINNKIVNIKDITKQTKAWFDYVNRNIENTDFSTDILSFIAKDMNDYRQLQNSTNLLYKDKKESEQIITARLQSEIDEFSTKDIGDIGENLIHGHECMRIKKEGREDLIHLIKRIPVQFAVGYDISSVECDERKRYIEVKTTISSKPLHFNKIHMTKNEWNTANSTRDRYYIYRLMLSKNARVLFLLQDPVGLYKADKIDMIPNNGADITFNHNSVGQFEELLTWVN